MEEYVLQNGRPLPGHEKVGGWICNVQAAYESDSNRVQRAVVLPDAARRPPEGSIMIRLGLRLRVWMSVPLAASYSYQEC